MRSRAARLATPAVIAALFITTFLAAPVFAIGVGNARSVVLRTLQALGLTYDSAGSTPISVTSAGATVTGTLTADTMVSNGNITAADVLMGGEIVNNGGTLWFNTGDDSTSGPSLKRGGDTTNTIALAGDFTVSGSTLFRASYEAFTGNDTLTEAESGKHCVATSGTPIWTLPEITLSGVVFSFKTLGGTARFTPNANDATRWSGGLTADAEPIELGINSAARIISDGGSLWLVEVEQNDIREETP